MSPYFERLQRFSTNGTHLPPPSSLKIGTVVPRCRVLDAAKRRVDLGNGLIGAVSGSSPLNLDHLYDFRVVAATPDFKAAIQQVHFNAALLLRPTAQGPGESIRSVCFDYATTLTNTAPFVTGLCLKTPHHGFIPNNLNVILRDAPYKATEVLQTSGIIGDLTIYVPKEAIVHLEAFFKLLKEGHVFGVDHTNCYNTRSVVDIKKFMPRGTHPFKIALEPLKLIDVFRYRPDIVYFARQDEVAHSGSRDAGLYALKSFPKKVKITIEGLDKMTSVKEFIEALAAGKALVAQRVGTDATPPDKKAPKLTDQEPVNVSLWRAREYPSPVSGGSIYTEEAYGGWQKKVFVPSALALDCNQRTLLAVRTGQTVYFGDKHVHVQVAVERDVFPFLEKLFVEMKAQAPFPLAVANHHYLERRDRAALFGDDVNDSFLFDLEFPPIVIGGNKYTPTATLIAKRSHGEINPVRRGGQCGSDIDSPGVSYNLNTRYTGNQFRITIEGFEEMQTVDDLIMAIASGKHLVALRA